MAAIMEKSAFVGTAMPTLPVRKTTQVVRSVKVFASKKISTKTPLGKQPSLRKIRL